MIDIDKLTNWIEDLKVAAKEDKQFSIDWFGDTKDKPLSIIAGWMEGFESENPEYYCLSSSSPSYGMCIKIAVNEGSYAYTDFELMNMPTDREGEVDDTCLVLAYNSDSRYLAKSFAFDWNRMMSEYGHLE